VFKVVQHAVAIPRPAPKSVPKVTPLPSAKAAPRPVQRAAAPVAKAKAAGGEDQWEEF